MKEKIKQKPLEQPKTESNTRITMFCWSCGGKSIEGGICADCSSNIIIHFKKPLEPPGYCGKNASGMSVEEMLQASKEGSSDIKRYRECCNCHRYWLCTLRENVLGICPHCKSGPSKFDEIAMFNLY